MGPTLDPDLSPSEGPTDLGGAQGTGAPAWWRLEMVCPPELEESLLWKLPTLGISRVAITHRPDRPQRRLLLAWLPESDWPAPERAELAQALDPLGVPFGLSLPPLEWHRQDDEDWSLSWKQHWQADPVGQTLLILPAWLEAAARQPLQSGISDASREYAQRGQSSKAGWATVPPAPPPQVNVPGSNTLPHDG